LLTVALFTGEQGAPKELDFQWLRRRDGINRKMLDKEAKRIRMQESEREVVTQAAPTH
jgi:hypothetical protein